MGKWLGTAPLSNRGNYTHGASLAVKYNNHSLGKAKLSQENLNAIGGAYDLAVSMLASAIDLTTDVFHGFDRSDGGPWGNTYKDHIEMYFGDNPDVSTVLVTLLTTKRGLQSNSDQNRLYIYSGKGKGFSKNTAGYVAQYAPNAKGRPQVESHTVGNPVAGIKTPRERGHIHIRLDDNENEMAQTIIHEATHRFAGTGDFAYQHDGDKWTNLSSGERLNNADSYAHFCSHVHRMR
ncbi:hypothetical protein R50072_32490 [Simiduia litorea]|uniref:M35 family metallo-endopeptidase n=1 Tax=Simiduia litorea TaxID=1435348 RepID=UPI0036F2FAA1